MQDFILVRSLPDLDEESQQVVNHAIAVLDNAYAPYSQFAVGAAILLADGTVICGTNQENASYPLGMCAERVALYALTTQRTQAVIKKMAVVAKRFDAQELSPATCCGGCRQVMLEFEQRQEVPFEIVMQNTDRQWIKAPSAASLLPFCFAKSSLAKPL